MRPLLIIDRYQQRRVGAWYSRDLGRVSVRVTYASYLVRFSKERPMHDTIDAAFLRVFETHAEGKDPPELSDDLILLESGLDSLGFAILVVELEEELGFDPFTLSEEAYYPQTMGEFKEFYEANKP